MCVCHQMPEQFNAVVVLNQLRYSGMLETVKIRQHGFPIRRPFQDFCCRSVPPPFPSPSPRLSAPQHPHGHHGNGIYRVKPQTMGLYYTALIEYYYTTELYYYSTTILQNYTTTVLLYYGTILPQYYSITIIQNYTTTVLQYYYTIKPVLGSNGIHVPA